MDGFIEAPSQELFAKCTKEQLLLLADSYQVCVDKHSRKTGYTVGVMI